ncbi:uncharacterized protein LOC141653934 [Silene latifolia]|uniref:uncharacterized protein LOC141653934 n=1 Tax=Silene latifolia TaxID=37657 RepID=UPI003D77C094
MPEPISSASVNPASYDVFDDPLYISTSDQPGLHLTEVKFNGEHFLQWKREVYQALLAKNKEGFIDGSIRITDKKDKKYHQWNRCDLLVRRWIANSMEPSIAETVKYASSAKELWSEILERYGQTNGLEIYQLKKDLGQISQDNASLVEYYSKLKNAWEDLDAIDPIPYCSCGALDECSCQLLKRIVDRESNSKLIHFLMGLNKAFDSVRTTVLSMEPLPPLNKALGLLQKIEKHRQISEKGHPCKLFRKTKNNNTGYSRGRGRNYNSGGRGNVYHRNANANNVDSVHFSDNPLEINVADQSHNIPATVADSQVPGVNSAMMDGIMQNVMQQVYKALSEKANSAGASSSVNFAGTDLYSQACTVAKTYGQLSWIVDTGASDHMTSYEDMLYDIRLLSKPIMIGLPDGTIKLVHKIGNIDLTEKIKLKDVLVVPDFKQNLLSVSRLIQHSPMLVLFTNKYCAFQDLSSKVPLALAEKKRGLYWFEPHLENKEQGFQAQSNTMLQHVSSSNGCNKECNLDLLHSRLGHSSFDKLKHVMNVAGSQKFNCETCIMSKFHVQPFQRSDSHAANLFELVHLDLWGPYRTASRTGAKYFLTILDDHSRVTWHHTTFTARDVIFHEDNFPYQQQKEFFGQSGGLVDLFHDTDESIPVNMPSPSADNDLTNTVGTNPARSISNEQVTQNIDTGFTASPATTEANVNIHEHVQDVSQSHVSQSQQSNVRQSARPRQISSRLTGYQLTHKLPVHTSQVRHRSNAVCAAVFNDLVDFSPEYVQSLANVISETEPVTFSQASQDSRWVDAMNKELKALDENQTWELTSLPTGHKPIGSRWVYKIKHKADGTIERFKARLVAKGYNQVKYKDYTHTFSPVAKFATVRVLLALAASKNWPIFQLDINNAFLHGFIDEEVYMTPPEGYTQAKPGQVCKLKRSLYGLKQASRQWNIELTRFLQKHNFIQSKQDYSLFTRQDTVTKKFTVALVYVDDVLLTGESVQEIKQLKKALHDTFTIKDLGQVRYFLGLEIARNETGLLINQRKFILDILKDMSMEDCTAAEFPLSKGLKLSTDSGDLLENPEQYRRLIGRLLYLSMTRPDISYSTQHLSQFLQQPRVPHMQAATHVVRYLKNTVNTGLFYPAENSLSVTAYSDSDWAKCAFSGRSLSGYCIFLGDSLISWKTKKQKTVSKSSAEAEYRSMSFTTSEMVWVNNLLKDLRVEVPKPIPLICDSQAAEHIAHNPVFHERTKHLEVDCHYVRDKLQEGFLSTQHIRTSLQLADLMTKALGSQQHHFLTSKLGLRYNRLSPA